MHDILPSDMNGFSISSVPIHNGLHILSILDNSVVQQTFKYLFSLSDDLITLKVPKSRTPPLVTLDSFQPSPESSEPIDPASPTSTFQISRPFVPKSSKSIVSQSLTLRSNLLRPKTQYLGYIKQLCQTKIVYEKAQQVNGKSMSKITVFGSSNDEVQHAVKLILELVSSTS